MTNPVIHFTYRTASFDLGLTWLADLPVRNIRKRFKLMLAEPDNNMEAIQTTAAFLSEIVADCEASNKAASAAYKSGWRYVANKRSCKVADRKIMRENNRLTKEATQAKKQFEGWKKIQSIWGELKSKMKIQEGDY